MRSVVLKSAPRCPRCQLRPRWCICEAQRDIAVPLAVDLLVHHREQYRPSSTGSLITRVVPAARQHFWRRERRMTAGEVRIPGRELWMLHPRGEPMPAAADPAAVQILLLDGSWRETTAMAQEIGGWGRTVSLPAIGESRYWLRDQTDDRRFSTAEALMFLLDAFGLKESADALQLQFELHVYASLRARGHKELAAKYLVGSPVTREFPELLARLDQRRPAQAFPGLEQPE
jgi:DTW domain-containing protein YfiP